MAGVLRSRRGCSGGGGKIGHHKLRTAWMTDFLSHNLRGEEAAPPISRRPSALAQHEQLIIMLSTCPASAPPIQIRHSSQLGGSEAPGCRIPRLFVARHLSAANSSSSDTPKETDRSVRRRREDYNLTPRSTTLQPAQDTLTLLHPCPASSRRSSSHPQRVPRGLGLYIPQIILCYIFSFALTVSADARALPRNDHQGRSKSCSNQPHEGVWGSAGGSMEED